MSEITLLDGGLGQELVKRSGREPTPLWSTRVMLDQPELVQELHREYFAAGATVATTNSYALHRDRLAGTGLEGEFEALHEAALTLAEEARQAHGAGRLAGSIGPLVASYRPETHPPLEQAVPLYAELATRIGPRVDFLICETVASLTHAEAALKGAARAGKPVWLAVTVGDRDGTQLRSGEPVADVLPIARENGAAALLANCSAPEAMQDALDVFAGAGLPYGAYANGFERITEDFLKDRPTVAALTGRDLSRAAYAETALGWVEKGATIVGGCCEIGPGHIAELARRLRDAGHSIV